jgi:hypothetical protein
MTTPISWIFIQNRNASGGVVHSIKVAMCPTASQTLAAWARAQGVYMRQCYTYGQHLRRDFTDSQQQLKGSERGPVFQHLIKTEPINKPHVCPYGFRKAHVRKCRVIVVAEIRQKLGRVKQQTKGRLIATL